jgi:hypothetical protein
MHNNQHNLKTHNMSKLLVIVLSIILLAGISLVPTLEIKVQGQVRQSPAPPTPGTIAPPASSPAPPSPGGSPSSGTPPPPPSPAPPSPGGSPSSGTPPALDTADGGGAANQTAGEGGGGAVNQSAVVMIPQSTMQMIMSQLQDAITAIDSNNIDNATKAMNSVDQELKSATNASGISIETTTG